MSETITLTPLGTLLGPHSPISEKNCTSFQISLNMTGGTFSLSVLKDTLGNLPENTILTLPFGRFSVIKNTGRNWSTGGLLDTASGPALPLVATQISFAAIVPGLLAPGVVDPNFTFYPAASLAQQLLAGIALEWIAMNPNIRTFNFRGVALSGVQQLAQIVLGEVIVNRNTVFVVTPGQAVGPTFSVPNSDIVNLNQQVDYSLDVKSVLNPAILNVNFIPEGTFIYDDQHAQKQPNQKITMGAPSGTGARDFVEIPGDWMIEGQYEDWTPPAGTDLSNPNTTANNGRYWKVFQSPDNPTQLRGVLNFTRLVKDLKLSGNLLNTDKTAFVGTPITAQTQDVGIGSEFLGLSIGEAGTEEGIYGFTADETVVTDITQNSASNTVTVKTAMQLLPPAGNSGDASSNFFSIQIGLWTFPRVLPLTFGVGNPANPYNLPKDVVIVNPSTNVLNFNSGILQYYQTYLTNYQLINSPRLKTSLTCVYRNQMPQPGDVLVVPGAGTPNCGRISSVTLNYTRGGITLNIQAEIYRIVAGLSGQTN